MARIIRRRARYHQREEGRAQEKSLAYDKYSQVWGLVDISDPRAGTRTYEDDGWSPRLQFEHTEVTWPECAGE